MVTYGEYLRRKACEYGFGLPKSADWVRYMETDRLRAARVLADLFEHFDLEACREWQALDVGCGHGGQLMAFQSVLGGAWGIDSREDRVRWARRRAPRARVVCGDAGAMPWPEGIFDLVVSVDTLEHVPFSRQAPVVTEMARVLKPGGHGVVAVPNKRQLFDEHNHIWFGAWMPRAMRRWCTRLFSSNWSYVPCFERTWRGWRRLFLSCGLDVDLVPMTQRLERFIPASRYLIYLEKRVPKSSSMVRQPIIRAEEACHEVDAIVRSPGIS